MLFRGRFGEKRGPDVALRSYERSRPSTDRLSICNAPFNNLYFRADGAVAPCWLQFHDRSPHWTPRGPSIAQIWNGPEQMSLRSRLVRREMSGPCTTCREEIAAGNRPLAAAYDEIPVGEQWPAMLELELSNQCNLECVMCSGMLSSRIRANRESLPPLEVPYDGSFLDQVVEMLPHLQELRLNGGEPLMQALAHDLLERVGELRPDLKVTIATNGTVWNSKVERALERCNIHLNISIDSLVPERYEAIRVHARFDVVMRNVERFLDYTRRTDRTLCIMVNPMRSNWSEMADYVRWCNTRDIHLWFNTIRYPAEVALHTMSEAELRRVHSSLMDDRLDASEGEHSWLHDKNRAVFERFRDVQLPAWIDAADSAPMTATTVQLRATERP